MGPVLIQTMRSTTSLLYPNLQIENEQISLAYGRSCEEEHPMSKVDGDPVGWGLRKCRLPVL